MDMYAAYKLATVMVNNPNTRPATTTPATQEGAYDCPYYAIEVIIIIIHFQFCKSNTADMIILSHMMCIPGLLWHRTGCPSPNYFIVRMTDTQ